MRVFVRAAAVAALFVSSVSFAQDAPPPAPASPPAGAGATAAPKEPPPPPSRPLSDQPPGNPIPKPVRNPPPVDTPAPKGAAPKRVATTRAPRRPKKVERAPGSPIANYPGFHMIDSGSRVIVEISRKVDVVESKSTGKLTYRLRGVATPTRTNRLPLLTSFFATPVSRIQLVDAGDDVDLVIELRQAADATHRILDTPKGMVLQIDFPKVAGPAITKIADDPNPNHAKRTTDTTRIETNAAY
jgi:hypothetical protein